MQIKKVLLISCLLLLVASTNSAGCRSDGDCESELMVCNLKSASCERKEVLPLTTPEIVGSVLLVIGLGLAQAAGIAGSFITIPILILIFVYSTKQAIALGFILMFCSSLTSVVFQIQQKTREGYPLIDYDLILISLPAISLGATLGTLLNQALPEILIVLLLVITLLFSINKSFRQYLIKQQVEKNVSYPTPKLQGSKSNTECTTSLNKYKNRQYPADKMLGLCAVLACSLLISAAKGGKGLDSLLGVIGCSTEYWTVILIQLVVVLLLTLLIEQYLTIQKRHLIISKKPIYFTNCDIQRVGSYFVLSLVASILGSCVGIGGGIIIMPFWLQYGVTQQQASASMTFLIFYNSLEAAIQQLLAGAFTYTQIIYYGFLATFASMVISKYLRDLAERNNRTSILILLLVMLMLLGMVLMVYIAFLEMLQAQPGKLFFFSSPC